MFRAPSSDAPSTPNSRRERDEDHPSTTPAGPPPTDLTRNSFTPAGPPPSTVFGSSQLQSTRPAFKADGRLGSNLFSTLSSSKNKYTSTSGSRKNGQDNFYPVLPSSPPRRGRYYVDDDGEEDAEGEEYDDDYEGHDQDENRDDAMDDDDGYADDQEDDEQLIDAPRPETRNSAHFFAASHNSQADGLFGESQGLASSRFGGSILGAAHPSIETGTASTQNKHDFTRLSRALSSRRDGVQLYEPDDVVLKQEKLLQNLHEAITDGDQDGIKQTLDSLARELPNIWRAAATGRVRPLKKTSRQENALKQAAYLATLLIHIHHPPNGQCVSDTSRSSLFRPTQPPSQAQCLPKVLLNWLNDYHLDSPSDVDIVLALRSNYSSSPTFWDAVMRSTLRGKFAQTVTLLRDANFSVAESAQHEKIPSRGYRDLQLSHIQKVVDDAIATLEACPALTSADWDVRGQAWELYRRRVMKASEALREYAEGQSYDRSATLGSGIGTASRMAESRVPWAIYENLNALYAHLQGDPDELISSSCDWVEAVIAITAWWSGYDEDQQVPMGSLAASRLSLSRSRSQTVRLVDTSPTIAYRAKLASALAYVIDSEDEELAINETDLIDVALGCILEGLTDGAITLIRSFSTLVAVAVEEIAGAGRWGSSAPKSLMKGFDKSDLMVLSFGKDQRAGGQDEVDKDNQLVNFARAVAQRQVLVGEDSRSKEGWQLAVQILSRLDNPDTAEKQIKDLIDGLDLDSTDRVDKILKQLLAMGFADQADSIAERYADDLASTTYDYGSTIYYYARAHNSQKLHSVLDLLTSLSLVNSTAYPLEQDLDAHLKDLLTSPREVAGKLAQFDQEAAVLLADSLSGYATTRKYYDLRDEEARASRAGTKPSHRPLARRKAAAQALVALISSASTPIRGGLYDPEAESVLQVDGLLVLLGETLPLLKMGPTPFVMKHLNVLLAAIEDLTTSPSLIRSQCEECLKSTLASGHGLAEPDSMRDLLKQSVSGLSEKTGGTASSQFSLVGSSLLSKSRSGENGTLTERAWDWRQGFDAEASAEDVLRVLRITLVDVIGRLWIESDGFDD